MVQLQVWRLHLNLDSVNPLGSDTLSALLRIGSGLIESLNLIYSLPFLINMLYCPILVWIIKYTHGEYIYFSNFFVARSCVIQLFER